MASIVNVNGLSASRAEIHVPGEGPWWADLDMADEADGLTGRVTIRVGASELIGTIRAGASGTFGQRRRIRVVGGADGWGRMLPRRSYHNDAGVKASVVAEDAAREAGEQLGSFAGGADRLAADYVRAAGPASNALEGAARGATWWVDYAGLTHVGERPASSPDASAYEVLSYDPRHREVVLAVDDLSAVNVGSTLSERLDEPVTVRSLELVVSSDGIRLTAWCPSAGRRSQLADSMRAIVERMTDSRLWGVYRYRVVRMHGDRVDVQAVRAVVGLPDLLAISMWPGVAGAHAELTPSAEVLVQFIEGDREQPVIVGFAGKDGAGHVPTSLTLCGSAQRVARQGDLVQCGGPGTIVTLWPVTGPPAPPNAAVVAGAPHLISFSSVPPNIGPAAPLYGAISTGSPKVRA